MKPRSVPSRRFDREISGVLLLDKPSGISSSQALQIARRMFAASKAGHTGTLDPMATGLLPVCFGEATKFSSLLLGADKTYEATLRLGYTSTTGDAEGEISPMLGRACGEALTLSHLHEVLQTFTGTSLQIPPMYSALKHKGKPMYLYAREGIAVDREPREIFIHELRGEAASNDEVRIVVACGTGTYIRTLAEDIGRALGYGSAYLTALRRTASGPFRVSDAITLGAIKNMSTGERDHCVLPVDRLALGLPAVNLNETAAAFLKQGRTVEDYACESSLREAETVRVYDEENHFLGLGEVTALHAIAPKRLINPSHCLDKPSTPC
ncbi:MAG TPA: tRNA pseudouridine(55) synthase TruB [Nitrosospira sp.]|nr:tRNA pseudouridine(55) synthase TruB [Nitrosospira sp.]